MPPVTHLDGGLKGDTKPPSDGYEIVIILASAYGGVKADSNASNAAKGRAAFVTAAR